MRHLCERACCIADIILGKHNHIRTASFYQASGFPQVPPIVDEGKHERLSAKRLCLESGLISHASAESPATVQYSIDGSPENQQNRDSYNRRITALATESAGSATVAVR